MWSIPWFLSHWPRVTGQGSAWTVLPALPAATEEHAARGACCGWDRCQPPAQTGAQHGLSRYLGVCGHPSPPPPTHAHRLRQQFQSGRNWRKQQLLVGGGTATSQGECQQPFDFLWRFSIQNVYLSLGQTVTPGKSRLSVRFGREILNGIATPQKYFKLILSVECN